MATRLVVGLGNPGPKYDGTRHNLGFDVTERLAAALERPWADRGRTRREARGELGGEPFVLLQPQTYMNNSGSAVRAALDDLGGDVALLVVCDDFHLPLGRLRCREGGSDGGQKGLKSVIAALPEREVPRLRLGLGEPPEGVDGEDYVLQRFRRGELAEVQRMVGRAADCLQRWLEHGRFDRLIAETNANGPPGG